MEVLGFVVIAAAKFAVAEGSAYLFERRKAQAAPVAQADLVVKVALDISKPEAWMRDAPDVDPQRRELAKAIRNQVDAYRGEVVLGPTDALIAVDALEGF